ncbi:STAS domain-containing protein [Thiohalobacter sp.]|uniref:STAS domain-containing protein n=1 Tax=Thiohalobacter sp. TaxID=2025948 RepID=UPI0026259194|nr:STAS domain-containing protein [Thiohalobacter sp.]
MNGLVIEAAPDGRVRVGGELGFATVTSALAGTEPLFDAGEGTLVFDLSGVERADSAGLALLIEWMRRARRAGRAVRFLNLPPQMLEIARAASLDRVLPLGRG